MKILELLLRYLNAATALGDGQGDTLYEGEGMARIIVLLQCASY